MEETYLICYRWQNVHKVPQHASLLSLAVENLFFFYNSVLLVVTLGANSWQKKMYIRGWEGRKGKRGMKEIWLIPKLPTADSGKTVRERALRTTFLKSM